MNTTEATKTWVIQLTPSAPLAKPIYLRSISRASSVTTPHQNKARRFTRAQAHSTPLEQAKNLYENCGFAVAPVEATTP